MTDITLTKMLDLAEAHAKLVMIDKANELVPLFDLRNAEGESIIVGGPFVGDTREEVEEHKNKVAAYVRSIIAERQIVKYSYLSEAWMLVVRQNDPSEPLPIPSESPDRTEVVIAIATDGDTYLHRRWLIQRKGKKCVGLKLDSQGETVQPMGRFDGLLGKPTRH